MATFHHARHFGRLSKIIRLTEQLLLWRWPPQFKSTNVIRFGLQFNFTNVIKKSTGFIKFSSFQIYLLTELVTINCLNINICHFKSQLQNFIRVPNCIKRTKNSNFRNDSLTTIPKIVNFGAWLPEHAPDNDKQNKADHVEQSIKDSLAKLCF